MTFTLRESIVLDVPLDDVWHYVTTEDEWRQPVVQEVRALTDGPVRAGSRYQNTVVAMGVRTHPIYEMTVVDPPQHLAWKQVEGGGPVRVVDGKYLLQALGERRTTFTIETTYQPQGFGRILGPVIKRVVRENLRRVLGQLETLVAPR